MTGVATAVVGGSLLGAAASIYSSGEAAEAAEGAAATQSQAQMAQLDYLKQREAIPQAYREQAIQQLGTLAGFGIDQAGQEQVSQDQAALGMSEFGTSRSELAVREIESEYQRGNLSKAGYDRLMAMDDPYLGTRGKSRARVDREWNMQQNLVKQQREGGPPLSPVQSREEFMTGLQQDPFYEQMVSTGEQAVLRGASATGGLRSGTASENLAAQNQAVLRNLYSQRVGQLQGLAGLPSNVSEIGQVMGGIGATQAQGQIGAAQARQQGIQGAVNIGLQGLNTALGVI